MIAPIPKAYSAAGVAGLLSIVPGLGQLYDGEPFEGAAWFATVVGLEVLSPSVHLYGPVAGKQVGFLAQAGYDLWIYNMYDAYRDARPSIGRYAKNTALENYIAAFNPLNVVDPVTGTYLGINLAIDWSDLSHFGQPIRYPFFAFVGMGEEGMFRGFLFPAFSDVFHSKVAGALTSTVLFDLFHLSNGWADFEANAIQRFIMGLVFCWATDRNKYDLRHGIFAHSMIDIAAEPDANASKTFLGFNGGRLSWTLYY